MLRTDDWSYYEGFSEVDGVEVMKFYGQVNRNDPNNIVITEKESYEDSYRNNIAQIRLDRREFEDKVYFEATRLEGLNRMVDFMRDGETPNCVQISDNLQTPEGGA